MMDTLSALELWTGVEVRLIVWTSPLRLFPLFGVFCEEENRLLLGPTADFSASADGGEESIEITSSLDGFFGSLFLGLRRPP